MFLLVTVFTTTVKGKLDCEGSGVFKWQFCYLVEDTEKITNDVSFMVKEHPGVASMWIKNSQVPKSNFSQ